ncbi:MAG: hypothetical protein LBH46_00075 [Rickettsiales bacterium]|jgi:hypothetical protein|nr:hypothetical protein [Rickettsiales bacterium]
MKLNNKKHLFDILFLSIVLLLFISPSFAGTEGEELSGAYDKLKGIVGGIGGKIVALLSGALGLIGCAVKFNPGAILSFLGVSIGVGSVSMIVDTTVTALF